MSKIEELKEAKKKKPSIEKNPKHQKSKRKYERYLLNGEQLRKIKRGGVGGWAEIGIRDFNLFRRRRNRREDELLGFD
jgi:hypothetical protein